MGQDLDMYVWKELYFFLLREIEQGGRDRRKRGWGLCYSTEEGLREGGERKGLCYKST